LSAGALTEYTFIFIDLLAASSSRTPMYVPMFNQLTELEFGASKSSTTRTGPVLVGAKPQLRMYTGVVPARRMWICSSSTTPLSKVS
jgi:hypothetical protein